MKLLLILFMFHNMDIKTVTLTTYRPSIKETDSSPEITASGFKINMKNPQQHRIIAVSRDLKKFLKWGSKVRIIDAGRFDGVYSVHDVMNKKYTKTIDILIGWKQKPIKLNNVKIVKL
jgi:3D (Asp-Asp-Asp) domain-containing protein